MQIETRALKSAASQRMAGRWYLWQLASSETTERAPNRLRGRE